MKQHFCAVFVLSLLISLPASAEEASSASFRVSDGIDYGNVGNLRLSENDKTLEVEFMAHPHGGIETLWFCFRIERLKESPVQNIRIVLANLNNVLGGGRPERMCPVIRYADGDWARLEPGQVISLEDGRSYAYWDFEAPEDFIDIAACYPYGVPDVEKLVEECEGFYRLDTLGLSQEGRPLLRLSNDPGEKDGDRPGIYLMARQHAGETPGSWVLEGVLRYFASKGEAAPLIWCAPLANIDSIEQGDYGKDPFPHDLNRAWGRPPMRHETVVFQRDARRWKNRCNPRLFIDFHAPGYSENSGFYAFGHKAERLSAEEVEAQARWGKAFKEALGDQSPESFIRIANYASRWLERDGSPTNAAYYFQQSIGVMSLSVECTYAFGGEKLYTEDDYREIGERMAKVIEEGIGKN